MFVGKVVKILTSKDRRTTKNETFGGNELFSRKLLQIAGKNFQVQFFVS